MEYSSENENKLDYPCDYSLQEDMSGSDDGNGCCLHVPPVPETPEQVHSKVRYDSYSICTPCSIIYYCSFKL